MSFFKRPSTPPLPPTKRQVERRAMNEAERSRRKRASRVDRRATMLAGGGEAVSTNTIASKTLLGA